MRIERLELKNFRGVDRLELELHPRFTLLVGGNGSGKTNTLEGLAVGLGEWIRSGIERANQENRRVERRDIRLERVEYEGALGLEPRLPLQIRISGEFGSGPISWAVSVRGDETGFEEPPERGDRTVVPSTYEGAHLARVLLVHPDARGNEADVTDYPVIAYYGTERLWFDRHAKPSTAEPEEWEIGSRRRGYRAALSSKVSNQLFQAWMAWRTRVVLQRLAELIKAGQAPQVVPRDPLLDAVDKAVGSCIEGVKRFFYDVSYREMRLELEGGQLIPFSKLSDGHRSLIALVADIAWRAAQLNPHHGSDTARKATGIVLIDQLELHLHPAWQRRIIRDLLSAFPKLQFVVTTHSPQIIDSARPEYIWLLHEGKVRRPGSLEGDDADAILRDIMGVSDRPRQLKDQLARVRALLDEGKTDEAKALLGEVDEQLSQDLIVGSPEGDDEAQAEDAPEAAS